MKNINVDYSLYYKYDQNYFLDNYILPIKEDDIYLCLGICKESNLNEIKTKFKKILKFEQYLKNDILFYSSSLEIKNELHKISLKLITDNTDLSSEIEVFFDILFIYAIDLRVSDIHIETFKNQVLFRFRIDGRLKTFLSFDIKFFSIISSYLKLIANLDITQNRVPQDGSFSKRLKNKNYDFRLSSMPTNEYESIVLRILDNKNILKTFENLGFSTNIYNELKNIIKLTQGLVLIAGPTGSGKTTTLYSILNEITSSDKKIITIEDPIEYKIDSICQVQINQKIGLSFELVLKNILRQDPDIIFIGEIRDAHSLNIALQASLTGHLVIASIHANDSTETINRLFDLQADPFLISTSLKCILSQRLVQSYCKECNLKGCIKCNYTKFHDRTCISELLKIDENISSMIFKKESISLIKKYLKVNNFQTLLCDGIKKVDANETSIEEVYKVINFL